MDNNKEQAILDRLRTEYCQTCGSQRCTGDGKWLDSCGYYRDLMNEQDINAKIDALEEKRRAAYDENQKVREQIDELKRRSDELYKEEFALHDEITKIKTGGTRQYLGEYVKVKDDYIYVTSVANEYNGCICAFGGPHFTLCQDGFDKRYYWFRLKTEHESAHHDAAVFVHKPDDVTVITREEFLRAYNECFELSRKHLVESLDMKPIGKRDNEYVFEEPKWDGRVFDHIENEEPIEEEEV